MNAQTGDLKEGDEAPSFCLPDKDDKETCLTDFKSKWIVLYFYSRDNTSGCTREAVEFTAAINEFEKLNTVVLGVSPDSVERHYKFAEKHNLGVTLLSDVEHKVLETYGVWQQKKMYGREFWGVVRSTFLIDPEGKVAHVWRKVKVKGHVRGCEEQGIGSTGEGIIVCDSCPTSTWTKRRKEEKEVRMPGSKLYVVNLSYSVNY